MGLTYTNYVKMDCGEVEFLSLSQKERERVANQIVRNPLANFGEVKEKQTAMRQSGRTKMIQNA